MIFKGDVEKTGKLIMGPMYLVPKCHSKVMFFGIEAHKVHGYGTDMWNGTFGGFIHFKR